MEDKRIGKGEGKIGNLAEKWEGGEGNRVRDNFMHPRFFVGFDMKLTDVRSVGRI